MASAPAVIQAKADFLNWLKMYRPDIYQQAMVSTSQLGGAWDWIGKAFDKAGEWTKKISDTAIKVGGAYVQGKSALDLVKANIARAKSGLPPAQTLEEAGYPYGGIPEPGYGIPQWAIYAGLGLVAILILKRR